MITRKNYLKIIEGIDLSQLDTKLRASKAYFDTITNNGKSWKEIDQNPVNADLLDNYFKALEIALKKLKPGQKTAGSFKSESRSISTIKRTDPIVLELRYLRRYINLDGKTKKRRQVELFLAALQRSIVGRQIRKTSQYAKDIMILQEDLIALLESFGNRKKKVVSIPKDREMHILGLLGWQGESKGIRLLKEFVKLQGKTLQKEAIKEMHNRIGRHLNKKKKDGGLRDSVSKKLLEITDYLKELHKGRAFKRKISLDTHTLNGITEIAGVGCLTEVNHDFPEKKKVFLQ